MILNMTKHMKSSIRIKRKRLKADSLAARVIIEPFVGSPMLPP